MRLGYLTALLALPLLVAAKPPRDAPEQAADSMDKVICKRFIRTGSLVDGYRECKTKREWQVERDAQRLLGASDSCRNRAEPDPLKANGGCAN